MLRRALMFPIVLAACGPASVPIDDAGRRAPLPSSSPSDANASPVASASPVTSATTNASAAPVLEVPPTPRVPGALAQFGSMEMRLYEPNAPLFAFDDARVWAIEARAICDVRTDKRIMSLEACAAADIFGEGDTIGCLKRSPARIEILTIPDAKLVSTIPLGIPDAKPRSSFDQPLEKLEMTADGGLLATVAEKRVTISSAPHAVSKVEDAPSVFSALAASTATPKPRTRERERSPNGEVLVSVDPATHAVTVRVGGKTEPVLRWAPPTTPIRGGFLADGGFFLWYGTSWERIDAKGRLVRRQARDAATEFMLLPTAQRDDDALVGTTTNTNDYVYRWLGQEIPLFTAGRCICEVPGSTLVVCGVIRKDATATAGGEGDVVLIDSATGKETARRSLGKSHLTTAHAAADGTVVLNLSVGDAERVDGKTLAILENAERAMAKHRKQKLGYLAAALPSGALLMRSSKAVWILESGALREVVTTTGDYVEGVAVSPNGKELAVVVDSPPGPELRLVDLASGAVRKTFAAPLGSYVGVVAYDRKGERVLTAAQGVVWIWDAK